MRIEVRLPLLSSGPEHRLPTASPNVALDVIKVWSPCVQVLYASKIDSTKLQPPRTYPHCIVHRRDVKANAYR